MHQETHILFVEIFVKVVDTTRVEGGSPPFDAMYLVSLSASKTLPGRRHPAR
jgi:hypothetical protein